ncbi:MAG: hypothetical protein A2008_06970 [Candidatus Wallbacteria bacterium GWC2_49_35]|uniref:PilN domain-containing protein n=1 Tax=Candidatus Wallbacteria bacterium GWC2_49_35 TaxID=1817813 RepID=A0A1F7WN63_9BACT|nr:MAG: hypothetical protein A2008_06970 [Candidatus Wallbacteria bacterium GWC2_49_35]HBC73805.1 hypothetical protein [Candidatus Wallbacteria bacterium]
MIKINLLPQKKRMHLPKIPIGTILGVLILLGLGYYLWVIQEENFQAQLEDLANQIKEKERKKKQVLADKQEKLSAIDQQINLYRQQVNLIKRLIGADMVAWSVVFEDLTYLVPKETVWLKSFQCEGDAKILMQGTARSDPNLDPKKNEGKKIMTSIAKFIENLDECYYIDNVYLSSSQKSQMHGQDIYQFSLSAKIDRTKKNSDGGGESGSGEGTDSSGGGTAAPAGGGE